MGRQRRLVAPPRPMRAPERVVGADRSNAARSSTLPYASNEASASKSCRRRLRKHRATKTDHSSLPGPPGPSRPGRSSQPEAAISRRAGYRKSKGPCLRADSTISSASRRSLPLMSLRPVAHGDVRRASSYSGSSAVRAECRRSSSALSVHAHRHCCAPRGFHHVAISAPLDSIRISLDSSRLTDTSDTWEGPRSH